MDHYVIVLILSYNGKYLLEEAIPSYLANDYSNFKLVVIDNGSKDGTKEWAEKKYPQVKVLSIEKNLGYSGGFNIGLKYAFTEQNADYVLISNNDIRADTNAISALVDTAEKYPKAGFVTGKVYYHDDNNRLQTVGKYDDKIRWNGDHIGRNEIDRGQYDQVAERPFIDDIFMLVSNKVYKDIGGYDPDLRFQAEEFDWLARAKKVGYKIYYTPYAKIWHKDSMTIGKRSAFKAYYDARNPMLVILKHKTPDFFRTFFWYHLKKGIFKSSLVALKQLRPTVFFAIWRGFFSALIYGFRKNMYSINHFINTGS